jgi:putative ABC transport system permease protein
MTPPGYEGLWQRWAAWPWLQLVLREWQHHPWRQSVALCAIALGVALAWSVHVINASALEEFSAAVRTANGQPDAVLTGPRGGFDEAVLDLVAAHPAVRLASPIIEVDTFAQAPVGPQPALGQARSASGAAAGSGARSAIRVIGLDSLRAAALMPELMPRVDATLGDAGRLAALDPSRVFGNAAAQAWLARAAPQTPQPGEAARRTVLLQAGPQWRPFVWSGDVAAAGRPLLVMDVAAAQTAFGLEQRLTRIDVRLASGVTPEEAARALAPQLPAGVQLRAPDDQAQRVSNLSRAYRVNLIVLALVALFVGSFLVYSILALSVAQRTPQLALLGVLGMSPRERGRLVGLEAALLGLAGSGLGLALGTALALGVLHWLAGDLGGGHFDTGGQVPALRVQPWAWPLFGALGVCAALVGAWLPARQAARLKPAQALKGLGTAEPPKASAWPGVALCAAGSLLALLPPVAELPLAAYASVACWLFGGVALVPWAVAALLAAWPKPRSALGLLALERARFQRFTATAAVAGVVSSLALSVALTVMVGSFREGVAQWLDQVLPADLYARTAPQSALAEQSWLPGDFVQQAAAVPGVVRVQAARTRSMELAPQRPAVTLFARELDDPESQLPMVGPVQKAMPGEIGVYVSEAVAALYGARPGERLVLPLALAQRDGSPDADAPAGAPASAGSGIPTRVLGVWRDYARQFGTVAMSLSDYRALTGDDRINDLALWLKPGTAPEAVMQRLREASPDPAMLGFASSTELRRISLSIFDRSFAVTRYLQAVAIGIGLVGVAASLSAQVLARRKEFGLLSHLGLTRTQVVRLVAAESAAWLATGALVGVALGAVISAVLVHVVNPQSFHWTMQMVWPWQRIALLALSVWLAGTLTAAYTARRAAGRPAVQSVREDW